LKVRVYDGSFHQVDSDSFSFELAAKFAFREACKKSKPSYFGAYYEIRSGITPEENTRVM
jgi:elongation factor G